MPQNDGVFKNTPWNEIAWRNGAATRRRDRAQAQFCRSYWEPIFFVLLKRGFDRPDAEDLTQSFLLHFLDSDALERANRARGRFRNYLLTALDHYLADVHKKNGQKKRGGGGVEKLSLDEAAIAEAETVSAHSTSSDLHFKCDLEWAADLLAKVTVQLEAEYAQNGRAKLFGLLKPYLSLDQDVPPPYWKLALCLRRSPVTLRKDVERNARTISRKATRPIAKGSRRIPCGRRTRKSPPNLAVRAGLALTRLRSATAPTAPRCKRRKGSSHDKRKRGAGRGSLHRIAVVIRK